MRGFLLLINAMLINALDQSHIIPSNGNLLVKLPVSGTGLHIVRAEGEGSVPTEATEVVTQGVLVAKMDELKTKTVSRFEELEARLAAKLADAKNVSIHGQAALKKNQKTLDAEAATKIEESIDAFQFGTVVHPGDDIAAVLASLANVQGGSGKVFLKAGIHQLSSTLLVASTVTLVGEGPSTVLKGNGAGAVIKLQGKGGGAKDRLSQVTLRAFAVDCGGDSATTPGVWLQNVEASFVEHLQFSNCQNDVQVTSSSKNWIQDNSFSPDPTNAGVGGIAEDESASHNVYRRNSVKQKEH